MPQVVSVKFRYSPKHLWFDPQNNKYEAGNHVLVETERGREVGMVVDANIDATDKQIAELKTPLKPVVRLLTELDYDHIDALDQKGKDALPQFRELVEKHELDMKPIEVEYLFSGDRAVFFFSSDERVDFRELVRELSSQFHVRVDMRQIGARDEARLIGGLAHCGEELCCARFGGDFQPVSIRMAKEQDLPLNPTKISGACGRLMCCLRYEYEAYKDFKKRAPKRGSLVTTPLGLAKITGFDTPREMLHLRLEDGKTISVPLAETICEKDERGCKQCSVSRETIDKCASSSMLLALSALDRELENLEDKLESDVEHSRSNRREREAPPKERTRRRRSTAAAASNAGDVKSGNKSVLDTNANNLGSNSGDGEAKEKSQQRQRPGQRSSGLRKRRPRSGNGSSGNGSNGDHARNSGVSGEPARSSGGNGGSGKPAKSASNSPQNSGERSQNRLASTPRHAKTANNVKDFSASSSDVGAPKNSDVSGSGAPVSNNTGRKRRRRRTE